MNHECVEILSRHTDSVQHADVSQLALRAEGVDSFRRHGEACSDVPYSQ